MRKDSYHKWLGHRNHIFEHHLEQTYRLKQPVSAQLRNAVYHNQHGQTTVTNISIVPRFTPALELDGVVVTMTQIKSMQHFPFSKGDLGTTLSASRGRSKNQCRIDTCTIARKAQQSRWNAILVSSEVIWSQKP